MDVKTSKSFEMSGKIGNGTQIRHGDMPGCLGYEQFLNESMKRQPINGLIVKEIRKVFRGKISMKTEGKTF